MTEEKKAYHLNMALVGIDPDEKPEGAEPWEITAARLKELAAEHERLDCEAGCTCRTCEFMGGAYPRNMSK